MNRYILIFLDKTVFRVAFWVVAGISKLQPSGTTVGQIVKLAPSARILVIRPGGLGDAIMAVPLLRALRNAYPDSWITIICVKKNHPVLELLPFHNELVIMDEPRSVLTIIRNRYDVVLDLEPFRRISAVVAWCSGAPVRVGFDTGPRRVLYTHLVSYAHDNRFESANMAYQLRYLGIELADEESADLHFDLDLDARERANEILDQHRVQGRLVAVAPGVLKPHHRWDMKKWAGVIESIVQSDPQVTILLVGGAADRPDTDEVLRQVAGRERLIDLVGKTSLTESLSLLERCETLLACDGGVVYMGAATGCATISLWGPGVMERFKPPGDRHIGVRMDYACIPCVTWDRLGEFPSCPYRRRCYNDLEASAVFDAYCCLKGRLGKTTEIGVQK